MQHHILTTLDQVNEVIAWAADNGCEIVAFDLETNSVNENVAKVWGIGLAFDSSEAFYIPVRDKQSNLLIDEMELSSAVNQILSTHKVIGHNVIYDCLVWKHNYNFDMSDRISHDTILLKHLIDEEPPFGLKEVAVKYLGEWADKAQQKMIDNIKANGGEATKTNMQMFMCDTEVLGEYCAWDVLLTYKLYELFFPQVVEQGLLELYETEVMPLYREVTIPMKYHGLHVDLEYFKDLKANITKEITQLEDKVMGQLEPLVADFSAQLLSDKASIKRTGSFPRFVAQVLGEELPDSLAKKALANHTNLKTVQWLLGEIELPQETLLQAQLRMFFEKYPDQNYVFNLRSKTHLKHLLFSILKLEPNDTTETGQPKADDDFLDTLEYPWAKVLQDLNKLEKIRGTYIDGILERQFDGVIYPSMLQFGTTSGRYASRNPNCLSLDTQILTDGGFKNFDEVDETSKIACFDGKGISWECPSIVYVSELGPKAMVTAKNEHADIRVTANHRMVFQDRKTDKISIRSADKFLKDSKILHGAVCLTSGLELNAAFLRFVVAAQADAEIRKDSSRVRFVCTKERKYKRLLDILHNLNVAYEDKSRVGRYEILVDGVKAPLLDIIGFSKTFPSSFTLLAPDLRALLLEEIFEWDGLSTRKNNYSSNNEHNVDIVQALCSLHGWRAHKRVYRSKQSTADNFQLDITRKNYSYTANIMLSNEVSDERVWCVEVPTGMFIARRGSDTFVTGNCQNLPRPKEEDSGLSELVLKYSNAIRAGFVSPEGYSFVDADYSALEPRSFAHVSGDNNLQFIFHSGEDMYSAIAKRVFDLKDVSTFKKDANFLGKLYPEKRQIIKALALAVTYGAEAFRIADLLKIDKDAAQKLIDDYLKAYPGLKKYISTCHYEANNNGMVRTMLGRVRHLEQARVLYKSHGHELLNSRWARSHGLSDERREYKNKLNNSTNFKIQGLAAHIVNRAMISIAREFKKNNIDGWVSLQIHDQIVVTVKDDQAEQAREIVKFCMENVIKLSVPLVAEPKIAHNLRDSH